MPYNLYIKTFDGWKQVKVAHPMGGDGLPSKEFETYKEAEQYLTDHFPLVREWLVLPLESEDRVETITVTQAHWDDAKLKCSFAGSNRECDCLVAQAIVDHFGGNTRVGHTCAYVYKPTEPQNGGLWYGDVVFRGLVRRFDSNNDQLIPTFPVQIKLYRRPVHSG